MIYFDSHVHIQQNFDLGTFFHATEKNFIDQLPSQTAGTFFLLLTEAKSLNVFADLRQKAQSDDTIISGGWKIQTTEEQETLLLTHQYYPEHRLFLVAGRQIVTSERLEVLALAIADKIADQQTLEATVAQVKERQGLAVLPWGAGKWLGSRGKIISNFIETANPDRLFIGDNGGRPIFWPAPPQFLAAEKRNIRLLPGSDPLPLAGEELRAGSYGAKVDGECSEERPATDLKALLLDPSCTITPYGNRQAPLHFLKNQTLLRLR